MRKISIATLAAVATVAALSAATPTFTTIYSFTNTGDGSRPNPPIIGPGGILYGATGANTVYALTPPLSPDGPWSEQTIYTFLGGSSDGSGPTGPLIRSTGPDGQLVLYGTTAFGGSASFGTVYSLTAPSSPSGAWTEEVLHFFAGKVHGSTDGAIPEALAMGPGGVLYGVTSVGGAGTCRTNGVGGCGTIFSLTPPVASGGPWTETVLYSFDGVGQTPNTLVIGAGGVLYGTTQLGGGVSTACGFGRSTSCGLVFSLAPPSSPDGGWAYTVIYDFDGTTGFGPGSLAVDASGILYGSTFNNVYSLTPPASPGGAWTQNVLATFHVPKSSGESPFGITPGAGGIVYGATFLGGKYEGGSLFKLTPPSSPSGAWTLKTLYSVNPATQGVYVTGFVIKPGKHPVWYGATMGGEITDNLYGTLFEFQP